MLRYYFKPIIIPNYPLNQKRPNFFPNSPNIKFNYIQQTTNLKPSKR